MQQKFCLFVNFIKGFWDWILKNRNDVGVLSNVVTVCIPIVSVFLFFLLRPWRWVMGLWRYWIDRKKDNVLFISEKERILRRKQEPLYEIEVSLRSLRERYPYEKYNRFMRVLDRLEKTNLFDKRKSNPNKKLFVYMGKIESNENESDS